MALLAGALPAAAGNPLDEPDGYEGNKTCADFGFPNEFKIDASGELPGEGEYEVGDDGVDTKGDAAGFEVEIEVDDNPASIDFMANRDVDLVLVKAGNGGLAYEQDPAAAVGHDLKSPRKESISHVRFCWDDDDDTPEEPGDDDTPEEPGDDDTPEEPGEEETPEESGEGDTAPAAQPVTAEPTFTG